MNAQLALAGYLLYLGLAFGARTVIQIRRTGSTGFHGLGGRIFSAEWSAGVLFAVALAMGFGAPLLDLAGVLDPIRALDSGAVHVVGGALFLLGLIATLIGQMTMGVSWRIGVDHSERTEMVTGGPFGLVRNPIFSAMIPTSLGLVLLVPNPLAVVGLLALVVALELQVRVVEEPYLLSTHGATYAEYTSRVGRFVPGIGRR
ncbi:MAG: isoprenylcysteine carboxylmethyltransferase family protein [Thermoleophilaceae bacterium]|nr:isoprenylcysteine carboxylmethyltransferase family protein [Thermoleophilaceae bacterium]